MVSGTTRLYGIMGHPVAHSLSPLMHTLAFQHHHLDCLYVPFPVAPADLTVAVAGAVALGVAGFNVTIPHKEAILTHLDEISAAAQFVGAVNTVRIHAGRTIGYNTDGEGFLQPLRALSLPFENTSVCVLGAGGAARAITMALLQAGCPVLVVANRTLERAERLTTTLRQRFPAARIGVEPLERAEHVARQSSLIVNTTSAGWHGEEKPLLSEACLRGGQVVYDIVYRPLHTPLLQAARRRGATVLPGIDMLIGQGAEAFRLWTGLSFPVTAVRRALEPYLRTTS
jgi:shikimate dehydrogenase